MQVTTNEPMRAAYEDETLVAYLDGELSSEEITAINSSLQHDSDLRKRIENLRTTWDLLEELPNEKPNFALVQSTIEMVSLAIAQEKKSWLQRILGNRWAMLTLATMLAFAVGVVTAQKRTSVQNQQFLEDLPIFVHYKEFANVDSTDWLKKLGSIDDLVRAAVRRQSVAEEMLPAALEGRSNWVKAADAGMRASIFEGQVAFRKDERREILRAVARQASEDLPNTEITYWEVLAAYTAILDQVGTAEQTQLNSIVDLDERAREVTKLVKRENAIAYAERLTPDERFWIRQWCDDLPLTYEFLNRFSDPDTKIVSEIYLPANDSMISDEELDELIVNLNAEARGLIKNLDPRLQRDVLGVWLSSVLFQGGRGAAAALTNEELRSRFEKLSNEEKSEMDFLSERDFRQKLLQSQ
jgi:hypothetical protein